MLRHTTEEVTQRLSLLITASIEPDIYYFSLSLLRFVSLSLLLLINSPFCLGSGGGDGCVGFDASSIRDLFNGRARREEIKCGRLFFFYDTQHQIPLQWQIAHTQKEYIE
jgi:hypothetical protein